MVIDGSEGSALVDVNVLSSFGDCRSDCTSFPTDAVWVLLMGLGFSLESILGSDAALLDTILGGGDFSVDTSTGDA